MASPDKPVETLVALAEIAGRTVLIAPDGAGQELPIATVIQPDPKKAENQDVMERRIATQSLSPYTAVTGIRL